MIFSVIISKDTSSIYSVAGTARMLYSVYDMFLLVDVSLGGWLHYSHLTDKETEVQSS